MRLAYRVRQMVACLTASRRSRDLAVAERLLPPAAFDLFAAMPPVDQDHALCVQAQVNEGALALQQAALMHDSGKALAGVRIWHRIAHVLVRRLPGRVREHCDGVGLEAMRQHAALGAELCAQAGLSEVVCQLVAHHDTDPPQADVSDELRGMLVALRQADDAC